LNGCAAIAIAREVGVGDAAIAKALAEFTGVGRRFQRYGEIAAADGGAFTLVDDYGHHPVEMAATIAAARGSFPGRRLVLAFQPHRYSRTRDLFEDFVRILSSVDMLLLSDVYPAGEAPIVAADGRALTRAVRVAGKIEPIFVDQIDDMPQAILDVARAGDVVRQSARRLYRIRADGPPCDVARRRRGALRVQACRSRRPPRILPHA